MPRTAEVTLGGIDYTIEQLPMRANRVWRTKLEAKLGETVAALQAMQTSDDMVGDIVTILHLASNLVLKNIEVFIDLLFEYSPALANDRERIETEAFDDEAFAALKEVALMGLPLDRILGLVPGLPGMQISTSLPSRSGDNGTQKSKAGRQASTR